MASCLGREGEYFSGSSALLSGERIKTLDPHASENQHLDLYRVNTDLRARRRLPKSFLGRSRDGHGSGALRGVCSVPLLGGGLDILT